MGQARLQDAHEVATRTMRLTNDDIELVAQHWTAHSNPIELDATRIFHGRGHCFPGLEGLCLEYFSPVLVVYLYEEPPEDRLQLLLDRLLEHNPNNSLQGIVVQRRYLTPTVVEHVWGELPESPVATEDGVRFHLNLTAQNVGFFLDMKNARAWLKERAEGWHVLNLFAYTCAFSVVAMKHGASSVVNMDVHGPYLSIGRNNHRLNDCPNENVSYLRHNVLKSWSKLRKMGPYDLIIHDPPQRQGNNFQTDRDYPKTVRRFAQMLRPGGYVMACLNSPHHDYNYLEETFHEAEPSWTSTLVLLPPGDFPDQNPNQGLKIVLFQKPQDTIE
ncbi:MAG: methyltransferase [Deltaproteobacteria bacterium]|nr:MAG: methyltransferase [Deltaproteobacteria bacterium]